MMILCRECGNSAPSADGFCSSCGALLDWAGERVENRPAGAAAPLVPPPLTPPTQRPTVSFTTAPSGQPQITAPQTMPPPTPTPRVNPDGRIPAPEPRRNDPVPIASEPEFTGPYCGACGTRNPEGRQFCRACGSLLRLEAASAGRRRGWWQRLFRRRSGYSAGERPGGFRDHHAQSAESHTGRKLRRRVLPRYIKLGKLAPLLFVLGLAGIGLSPARSWVSDHVFSVFDKAKTKLVQQYDNVTPTGASGDAEPGHGANLAVDGLDDTYWADADHTDAVGDTITVTFATPVDIDQIGLLSGADPTSFRTSARPRDLTVTGGGAGSSGGTQTVSLDDTANFQSRPVHLRHVTSITFTVKDSYSGQQKHDLAIREIEFFVRSAS
jgi:hypothetical protein